jgi:hypothetical protein
VSDDIPAVNVPQVDAQLRGALSRLERTAAALQGHDESGWVIERDASTPTQYWTGWAFSPNNLSAIRFCRRVDAEQVRGLRLASRYPDSRVAEHLWIGA